MVATFLGLCVLIVAVSVPTAGTINRWLRRPKPGLNGEDDAGEWAAQLRAASDLHAQAPARSFLDFLRQARTRTVQLAIAMSPAPLSPLWLPGIGDSRRLAAPGASRVREPSGWPRPQSPLAQYPAGALELLTPKATPVARVHFDDDTDLESFRIATTRPPMTMTRTEEFPTTLVESTPIHDGWREEYRLGKTLEKQEKRRLERALRQPTQEMRAVFDAIVEDWLCSHCDVGDHGSCPGCSCPAESCRLAEVAT
jgi:hypothetical protein